MLSRQAKSASQNYSAHAETKLPWACKD